MAFISAIIQRPLIERLLRSSHCVTLFVSPTPFFRQFYCFVNLDPLSDFLILLRYIFVLPVYAVRVFAIVNSF